MDELDALAGGNEHSVPPTTDQLTIRDLFAFSALTGMFAGNSVPLPHSESYGDGTKARAKVAQLAYLFADAMMAERAKPK